MESRVCVDPFVEFVGILIGRIFLGSGLSGKTVRSRMLSGGNVHELEVEQGDGHIPAG